MTSANPATRRESDFLGEKRDSGRCLLGGAYAPRGRELSDLGTSRCRAMPELMRAFGYVKKAAARANAELGALEAARAERDHGRVRRR